MLGTQLASFFTLFKWMAEQYLQLERKVLPYSCKVTAFIERNNQKLVQIQFSGHNHTLEIDIQKLINENLFEYFSPTDKKSIFSAFYQKTLLKMTETYRCPKSESEMIVFTNINTGNKLTCSASDFRPGNELFNQIDQKDAFKIGYISGIDHVRTNYMHVVK